MAQWLAPKILETPFLRKLAKWISLDLPSMLRCIICNNKNICRGLGILTDGHIAKRSPFSVDNVSFQPSSWIGWNWNLTGRFLLFNDEWVANFRGKCQYSLWIWRFTKHFQHWNFLLWPSTELRLHWVLWKECWEEFLIKDLKAFWLFEIRHKYVIAKDSNQVICMQIYSSYAFIFPFMDICDRNCIK